jgi:hypothetical protein
MVELSESLLRSCRKMPILGLLYFDKGNGPKIMQFLLFKNLGQIGDFE